MSTDNNDVEEQSSKKNTLTISFLFTDKDVGAIIGRRGDRIREIKEKSRCNLTFHGRIGSERVLSIYGDERDLPFAVYMVASSLLREPRSTRDLDEAGDYDQNVILLLLLPQNTCGAVIGKQGSVVKNIINDTGAKILVFFEKESAVANGGIAKIQGTPEKIKNAVIKIIEIIQTFPSHTPAGGRDSSCYYPWTRNKKSSVLYGVSHKTSQTLFIDNKVARIIVGKAGSTINELRKISKAFIQVSNTDNRNESSLVVSGDPSSVAVALHLIELRINSQFEDRLHWNGNRDNHYKPGYRSRNNYGPAAYRRTSDSTQADADATQDSAPS